MREEIDQLRSRVEALEEENAALREGGTNPPAQPLPAGQTASATAAGDQNQTTLPQTPIPAPFERVTVKSKYPIQLYGRLQFDATWGDSRVDQGNYTRWVLPEDVNVNDDQFNLTAVRTRVGVKVEGPEVAGAESSALVEADFFGGGDDNKARFRMRHAFVQLYYPESELYLMAGQGYDLFSPLIPPTVNSITGYYVGNLGFRRTQVRASKTFSAGGDASIVAEAGVSRTIGEPLGPDPVDTGEDSGFPATQARLAYAVPLWTAAPAILGFSGHYGQEEYDTGPSDNGFDLDSWSANIDLTLPLWDKFELLSELWVGENLDTYVGGVNQGVNPLTQSGIRAMGGWAALSMGPWDAWRFNLGASIDDPKDEDLPPGGRSQNLSFFGNVLYNFTPDMQLGFEASYWRTDYADRALGDSLRLQASLKYRF